MYNRSLEMDERDPLASEASDAGDPVVRSVGELPDSRSAWRFYWLSVATFGFYLLAWIHHVAKRGWPGRRYSLGPIPLALGCLCTPVCASFLYDCEVQIRACFARRGIRRPGRAGGVVVLHLMIVIVFALTPLRLFWIIPLVLLPLPFVLIQSQINTLHRIEATGHSTKLSFKPVQRAIVGIGTPLLAAGLWLFDVPTSQHHFTPSLAAGTAIAEKDAAYTLTIPSASWRRVQEGTVGEDSDLELSGPGEETWLVTYSHQADDGALEETVAQRRSMIFESGNVTAYEEVRLYLDAADHHPVSIADYYLENGIAGHGAYVVATALLQERVIEVIGYTEEPQVYLSEIKQLVKSLAIRREEP